MIRTYNSRKSIYLQLIYGIDNGLFAFIFECYKVRLTPGARTALRFVVDQFDSIRFDHVKVFYREPLSIKIFIDDQKHFTLFKIFVYISSPIYFFFQHGIVHPLERAGYEIVYPLFFRLDVYIIFAEYLIRAKTVATVYPVPAVATRIRFPAPRRDKDKTYDKRYEYHPDKTFFRYSFTHDFSPFN